MDFLVTFLQGRVQRARSGELDRGASAVEWVIISAVVVAIVGVVAAIINAALSKGATKVGDLHRRRQGERHLLIARTYRVKKLTGVRGE